MNQKEDTDLPVDRCGEALSYSGCHTAFPMRKICGMPFRWLYGCKYSAGFSPEGPTWSLHLRRLPHKLILYKLVDYIIQRGTEKVKVSFIFFI
jgi:hypothetical protein